MEIVCKWKIGCFFFEGAETLSIRPNTLETKSNNKLSKFPPRSLFTYRKRKKKELKIKQKIEGEEFSWLLFNRVWKIRANIGPSKGINCVEARFISRRAEDQPPLPSSPAKKPTKPVCVQPIVCQLELVNGCCRRGDKWARTLTNKFEWISKRE